MSLIGTVALLTLLLAFLRFAPTLNRHKSHFGNRTLSALVLGAAFVLGLSGCDLDGDSGGGKEVAPPTVQSITATPATISLTAGDTQQLHVVATLSDGTTQDVSSSATYASSAASVATVSAAGLVTAVSAGNATMSINYLGQGASVDLTVAAPVIPTLSLSSSSGTIVAAGVSLQLIATHTTGSNSTVVSGSATYSSSNTAVATVSSGGAVTAVALGSAVITATYQGLSATIGITVTAATVQSLAIAPGTAQIAAGITQQLQATVTLSDNSSVDVTGQATYVSSAPAVATVNSVGVVTGVSAGAATITASYQGHTATANITVTPPTTVSLAIAPNTVQVAKGITQQLQVTATLSDNTTADVTSQATYVSSAPAVATVNSAGVVTGVAVGTTMITASYQGNFAMAGITVTPPIIVSIALNPSAIRLAQSTDQQLQALAKYSDGTIEDVTGTATWSTSPSVATISSGGLLTAVGTGTATVTATTSGVSGAGNLTVTAATLESVVLLPENLSVAVGEGLQLTALGVFSDGSIQDITDKLVFATSDPSMATVSSSGRLSGVGPGAVTITAFADASLLARTTTTIILVIPNTTILQSLAITPSTVSAVAGRSQQLSVSGTLSDGSIQDLTESVVWASSDTNVASVDAHGAVTALNAGATTITATVAGVPVASATFTVTSASLVGLAVTPGSISLAVGQTHPLFVTATLSDGTTQDVTGQAIFEVSAGLGLVINGVLSDQPVVLASLAGAGTITASLDGHIGQATLTVGPSRTASISTPASLSVPLGSSTQLQALLQYNDGTSQLATRSMSFSSNLPSIAMVDALGNVTGVQSGTAVITATYDNPTGGTLSSATTVTVNNLMLSAITLTASGSVNSVGIPIQTHAIASYSDGTTLDVTRQVHMTSSNPSVAVVDNLGSVVSVAVGSTQISATLNGDTGHIGSMFLNIGNAVLQSIAVTAPATLAIGTTSRLAAIATFSDSSQQDVSSLVAWSSSNPSIALVDSAGSMAGVATGTANAVATLRGVSGQAQVSVLSSAPATLTSITVTSSSAPLMDSVLNLLGVNTQFTATGHYSDGSTVDLTSAVQWGTSNGSMVILDSQGMSSFSLSALLGVIGLGPNVVTVVATNGGVSGTAQIIFTVL